MLPNFITKTITLPNGGEITIETGKLAKQADGAVVVKMGNTMLLATVVSSEDPREDIDFLPLSVDYQEKFAAAGKIPGGFLKREARLSDYEILISRLVDRAIRPLFPDDYHCDTQVNINLISADVNVEPDALAAFAASCALAVSDIPFQEPISEVRVVKIGDDYIINPTPEQRENSVLELIVAASMNNIMMVEGEAKEVSETDMIEAIKVAHEAIKIQCQAQVELTKAAGKEQKRELQPVNKDEALEEDIRSKYYQRQYDIAKKGISDKVLRKSEFKALKNEFIESLPEEHELDKSLIKKYFHDIEKEAIRNSVLDTRKRLDGRDLDEVRPIWSEVDYLPMAHGSAIFTRGETQSLTTVTLGTKLNEQMIDSAMMSGYNKFMLHYNFPGFSTGEVKPNRGPGRREIGHGNLAMRSLKNILPQGDDNPYTIRIVSDILESNGSSSMATVCAGTLALMDAGIKIKAPVSGIAMGMISDAKTGKYAILSDILGDEDHLGDMDFKVTGTENGITACQMDIKVDGLSYDILIEALEQARKGRLHILGKMKETLAESRAELKPHAPRSVKVIIEKEMIGAVIGPGGKVVQEIQKETGATVIIEEINNTGVVSIFAASQEAMDAALKRVNNIAATPDEGGIYEGKVKSIMPFGAFVEFMPGKDGLLHISEIKWERIEKMDGILEVGEEIQVKLIEIDKKTGKYRLSRKALLPKPEKKVQE
ncbi:MAG: polyribonucleotide nucleotidyltransferase [Bacteroidetes bacterium]|nr:polyribonucleotide nucleotidyltransferase [Bacteroidota bacterium]MDA1119658.1 polyribonucleotide nucleotidyltransferase [Bacteroidota bacterium]